MANKNIYEVLDEFKTTKNKADRLDVLRKNDSYALKQVLLGVFHPQIKFTVKEEPKFRREPMPVGMSYDHMTFSHLSFHEGQSTSSCRSY